MAELIQPQPEGFQNHVFERVYITEHPVSDVWNWLNAPETFTDTQVSPYKVEFYSPNPAEVPNGFHEGVLNIHYGPLINFAGVLTSIKEGAYRDLQYFYGSYAFSIRWLRPYRLEFWLEETKGGATHVRMRLSTWAKPWIASTWSLFLRLFWSRFGNWMNKAVPKAKASAEVASPIPAS